MYATIDNNSTILFSKDIKSMYLTTTYRGTNRVYCITLTYSNNSETILEYDKRNTRDQEFSLIADWIDNE